MARETRRRMTETDLENFIAQLIVEVAGRTDETRAAFRALPAELKEEIHARAADERARREAGVVFY